VSIRNTCYLKDTCKIKIEAIFLVSTFVFANQSFQSAGHYYMAVFAVCLWKKRQTAV